uniref:Uncharacterized protein n=1 Tax=Picea glauca TaxID=3330 RepID=A0A101M5T3_PICGL|nr:hypothetical protein ABT39_MTgene1231 [Picea glauca]QHR92379.1 hypothetical protein Q903MT_gene6422 [Picea sitchensis]
MRLGSVYLYTFVLVKWQSINMFLIPFFHLFKELLNFLLELGCVSIPCSRKHNLRDQGSVHSCFF